MKSEFGRYINDAAYEAYLENDGQEVIVTKLVPLPPDQAFDAWLKDVWVKAGTVVRKGTGRGMIGSVRKLPLGLIEEIIAVGEPRANGPNNEDDIPSVSYIIRDGPVPVNNHLGFVRFVPDTSSNGRSTLIAWSIKYTPTTFGHVFCCGGSILRLAFRHGMNMLLDPLVKLVTRKRVC
jgi:hypothetical protein